MRRYLFVGAGVSLVALAVLLVAAIIVALASSAGKAPVLQVSALAAGGQHTCLIQQGDVFCWGDNESGQLGNGISAPEARSPTPVRVAGLSEPPLAVVAGAEHTCALLEGGGVECWGANFSGQLGDGDPGGVRSTPVDVIGLEEKVLALTTTFLYTCALTRGGGVLCWGDNSFGQLGDGTTESADAPVPVAGLDRGVVGIAAGQSHTCALLSSRKVRCWGNNGVGQVGDGTTVDRLEPVDVLGLPEDVVWITAGYSNTCALTKSGHVWCWGLDHRREFSQSAPGEYTFSATPVRIEGLRDVVAVDSGVYHSCALSPAGGVQCWGTDQDGEIGDGEFEIPAPTGTTPSDVAGLESGVRALDVGAGHTCAVLGEGSVKCWGYGYGWTPKEVEFVADGASGDSDE